MKGELTTELKKDESKDKFYDPIENLVQFLVIVIMFLMFFGLAKFAEYLPCFCLYQPEFPQKNK
jgi:hypothetical protein